MRRGEGTEENLEPTVETPSLGEAYVLAACGASTRTSRWSLHQVLTGRSEPDRRISDPIDGFLRENLERYFEQRYGATIERFGGDTTFLGRFHCTRPTLVREPGTSPARAGDVLMIETPSRRAYDATWGQDYDLTIPDAAKARANIRMAVTASSGTLVWVFADNGAVNEMHRIGRDDAAIKRMREGCFESEADAQSGIEPAPDDEDMVDYIVQRAPTASDEIREYAESTPEAQALRDLEILQEESNAVMGRERSLRTELRNPKNRLLRALADRKAVRIGDTIVRKTVVNVEPRERSGYTFVRIDIERA